MNSLSAEIFPLSSAICCCHIFFFFVQRKHGVKCRFHFSCRLAHGDDYNVAIMAKRGKKNKKWIINYGWRAREQKQHLTVKSGSTTWHSAARALTVYPWAVEGLPFEWVVVYIGKKNAPTINSRVLDFCMSFFIFFCHRKQAKRWIQIKCVMKGFSVGSDEYIWELKRVKKDFFINRGEFPWAKRFKRGEGWRFVEKFLKLYANFFLLCERSLKVENELWENVWKDLRDEKRCKVSDTLWGILTSVQKAHENHLTSNGRFSLFLLNLWVRCSQKVSFLLIVHH